PDATRKDFHQDANGKKLSRRAQSSYDVTVCVETQLERAGIARRSNLLVKSGFSTAEIAEAIERLAKAGKAVFAGEWVADGARWQVLRQRATDAIDGEHKRNPQHLGLPLNELRSGMENELAAPE